MRGIIHTVDLCGADNFISAAAGDQQVRFEAGVGTLSGDQLLLARQRKSALSVELQAEERSCSPERLFPADHPCPFSQRCEGGVRRDGDGAPRCAASCLARSRRDDED